MTKKIAKRSVQLASEFDAYLSRHPDLYDAIPDGATVVMSAKGDPDFEHPNTEILAQCTDLIVEARKEGRRWKIQKYVPA